MKSCSSPNESEFVSLPVFPTYPYYLTIVRLWHVHWLNASFSPPIWHFLSLSLIFFAKKEIAKEILWLFSGATPKEAVFDADEGCFKKQLGKRYLEKSDQKWQFGKEKHTFSICIFQWSLTFPFTFIFLSLRRKQCYQYWKTKAPRILTSGEGRLALLRNSITCTMNIHLNAKPRNEILFSTRGSCDEQILIPSGWYGDTPKHYSIHVSSETQSQR